MGKYIIQELAVHAVDNGHSVNFDVTTIVDSERVTWKSKYKEGIHKWTLTTRSIINLIYYKNPHSTLVCLTKLTK